MRKLKILSIGNFGYGWDGSICDEEHIAQALEHLGHDVVRAQRERAIDFISHSYGFDFTLIAQWDGYSLEDSMLITLPHPIVYWAFDYQADGQEWHERLVKGSDLYLSKCIADNKYPNWQWLSQDFAPQFLDIYGKSSLIETPNRPGILQDIDVLFTGTYLSWATERNQTLKAVDDHYNLTIHSVNPAEWISAGFKHVNGPVMDEQLPKLIARAKINLSIDHTIEAGYWSDRNAQIMTCGGFVLFRYVPLSEVRFRDGVSYFVNTDQCLAAIDGYLKDNVRREAVALQGYRLAKYNLGVMDRVQDFLTIVGSIL